MRRIALAVCIAPLLACGATERLPAAPLAWGGGGGSTGYPLLGEAPTGSTIRFIERGRFAWVITFHNRAAHPVTVVGVRTPEGPRALIRLVRTRFAPFAPRTCPRAGSCPGQVVPIGKGRPAPYTVAPGKEVVAVTLAYRVGSCAQLRSGFRVANRGLFVDFRDGSHVRTQRFSLGYLRWHLRPVPASACDRRPHSSIALDGPYATSTAFEIPWEAAWCVRAGGVSLSCAGADTCGDHTFRSGVYQSPGRPAVRVEIDFRAKRVTVWVGIGRRGWTPFRSSYAVVGPRRFHATVSAPRRPAFRVWGTWRCATGG